MMIIDTTRPAALLASCALAVGICFSACGKKEDPVEPPTEGAQSSQGKMLEAAQKVVDEANARTERVEEAAGE